MISQQWAKEMLDSMFNTLQLQTPMFADVAVLHTKSLTLTMNAIFWMGLQGSCHCGQVCRPDGPVTRPLTAGCIFWWLKRPRHQRKRCSNCWRQL